MKQKPCNEIDFSLVKPKDDQYFKLYIPIFESDVEFIYSPKALEKRIKAVPGSDALKVIQREYIGESSFGVTYNCAPTVILFINTTSNYFSFINVLTHEIRHVVDNILYDRSFEHIPGNNNEVYAYLTGYITEEIMKKMKFVNNC